MAAAMPDMARDALEAYDKGDYDLAVTLYTQVINAGPAVAEPYLYRARALDELGKQNEALVDLDEAIALAPNTVDAYMLKGTICTKLKNYQIALNALMLGLSHAPGDEELITLQEECKDKMSEEESEARKERNFKLSADICTQAIDGGLASADVYTCRALALIGLREYTCAAADANCAIELQPTMCNAYILKGFACMKIKEYKTAIATLKEGSSSLDDNSTDGFRFSNLLNKCRKQLEHMAEEAYAERNFQLTAELYSDSIDAGSTTARVYRARAFAYLNLVKYNEALADVNKAIELDPRAQNAYLLKGILHFKLEDYLSAKAAFEIGSSFELDDSRLADVLNKCNEHIRETTDSTMKTKYSYGYYNKHDETVLSIYANKEIPPDGVLVEFEVNKLNVSIKIPGEQQYDFEFDLFAETIPGKSTFNVLPKKVEIRLAKAKHVCWTSLSCASIPTLDDYEFSWRKKKLHNINILPQVKNQGKKETCTFYALATAAEIEVKRKGALQDPPESSKLKISANDFGAQFEKLEERTASFKRCANFFKERGVLARQADGTRVKYKIKGCCSKEGSSFKEIQALIRQGRAVVGSFGVDEKFGEVPPDGIYDYDPTNSVKDTDGKVIAHAVVFIGFGVRAGRQYLVFINSHGTDYCDQGFGRVDFGSACEFHTVSVF